MRRVLVRGTSGCGKSTLAKAIAERLAVPYVELDSLYHLPGWQESTLEEFRSKAAAATAGDAWVVDGNYSKVQDLFLGRVDTVVWLDYPLPLVASRIIRRTARRVLLREPCCNGNYEDWRRSLFSRDSVIVWSLTTHARRRRQADEYFASRETLPPNAFRFRHPRETERWLDALPATS